MIDRWLSTKKATTWSVPPGSKTTHTPREQPLKYESGGSRGGGNRSGYETVSSGSDGEFVGGGAEV